MIRNACPFRACLSRSCANDDVLSFATRTTGSVPFWLWPDSRFGHSILTRVQSTVHVRYPCGTSLAPRPPSCWQSPRAPSRDTRATKVGDVVGWASHRNVASPACHRRLPLVAHRVAVMTGVMCDEAIQDIATLWRTLLSVFTYARMSGNWGANVQAMNLCSRSWDAVCRPLVVAAYMRSIVTVPLERIRGFPSRHPTELLRAFLRRVFHPGIYLPKEGRATPRLH